MKYYQYLLTSAALIGSTFVLADPVVVESQADVVKEEPVRLIKVPASNDQAIGELLFQFQNLQMELTGLRGEVEELRYQLDQLKAESKDRYIDLDRRISGGKVVSPESITPDVKSPEGSTKNVEGPVKLTADPKAIQDDYNLAKDLIRQKDYVGAIQAFNEFVANYPTNEYTANAYYWMGEVYLVIPDVDNAIRSFSRVVTDFRAHHKHPDSLYRLGITLLKNGDVDKGRYYLEQLLQLYPDSQLTSRAKKALESS